MTDYVFFRNLGLTTFFLCATTATVSADDPGALTIAPTNTTVEARQEARATAADLQTPAAASAPVTEEPSAESALNDADMLAETMVTEPESTLKQAIRQAIDHHPEVQEKWHSFLAAGFQSQAATSGYRPRVDLTAGYDYQRQDYGPKREYDGGYADLTLRQMLFDGFLTRSETGRFDNLQLVSYFNLLDASEQAAFNAFSAYQDVLRQRELVELARTNLSKHHTVFKQVEKSAKAGVARSADLEQINGRLALAQANLITEMSNLHDISARYLRVVGSLPPAALDPFEFAESPLPEDVRTTLLQAYQSSPVYHAALRNILASEHAARSEKSGYYPQVDLKARYGTQTYDSLGYDDGQSEASIGLELRFNLYNGGRDRASIRRALQEVNVAKDQRDQACINIRQSVQVAFNDTRKVAEQLPILNQHRLASDRVSTAYKQQFDIGQRSLLDVLDTENEFFQASRAWVNARYDLNVANARTLASMGRLIEALNLFRTGLPALSELGAEQIVVDEASACPALDINSSQPGLQDTDMDGTPDVYDQCPETPLTDKADAHGCSVFTEKEVSKNLNIQFDKASAVVNRLYYPEIEELAKFLRRYPKTSVEIRGHSSQGGSEKFNLRLSQVRAEAVASILISNYGIKSERVTAKGYGTSQLLRKERTPEADRINRRIEARVTATAVSVVKRQK